jgi:hypothetical protein
MKQLSCRKKHSKRNATPRYFDTTINEIKRKGGGRIDELKQ